MRIKQTPFLAVFVGRRTPIVAFRGSALREASVGETLNADSTLGSAPVSSSSASH